MSAHGTVTPDADPLAAVAAGDRGALARAISELENSPKAATRLSASLAGAPERALRIGVTGAPGGGKSTLVGALVSDLLDRGRTVGALLVDPSSPLSGGAVLGDRVRLKARSHPRLYVRSIASRGGSGGVAAATASAILLLERWGADVVIVETVGAGQGDVDVCRLADITAVICPPGLGDELQAMKAGLMEIADVLVVTKADRPGAGETAAGLADAGPGGRAHAARDVLLTSAATGEGIRELVDHLERQGAELRASGDPSPASADLSSPAVRSLSSPPAPTPPPPSASARAATTLADPFDLTDRVAIVTGATSGLGRRFAEVLHAAGACVVLAGRRADRLRELEDRLERAAAVPGDITDPDHRAELVRVAVTTFGRLDIVVNNAGVSGPPVPAEEFPSDRWETTIGINLSALFETARVAGAHMLEQGSGSVINITSVFGLVANAPVMDAAYAASKGAVVNLTRELAVEWATRGVRVNAIAPGWFPSEMTADMIEHESSQRYIRRSCPMQRMGREEELDGALLFLASSASSYCTGQTLAIDGGWTAR